MNLKIKNNWKVLSAVIGILLIFAALIISFNIRNKNINLSKNILEESGKMVESKSSDWWLNSGGIMNLDGNNFSTNIGSLPKNSYWQKLYAKTNPEDTDNGYHPQNIFRLVSRQKFQNFSQSVYFYIDNINLSESKNRNESNGVLLFNRYQDGDNLYYAGIRVDGHVVIKKKIGGKYYTMAEKDILSGGNEYDRVSSYNFIPTQKWIGIKSELENSDSDDVKIRLYVDLEQNGNWQLVLETEDQGDKYGKKPFSEEGYAGIRTDFMDAELRDYKVQEL